ncbi:MAG: hypothetical protein GJ680_20025 [Alteromonadaceae bacterium]|nr:hypothetical protein [Alteromonadaceae bacterium]
MKSAYILESESELEELRAQFSIHLTKDPLIFAISSKPPYFVDVFDSSITTYWPLKSELDAALGNEQFYKHRQRRKLIDSALEELDCDFKCSLSFHLTTKYSRTFLPYVDYVELVMKHCDISSFYINNTDAPYFVFFKIVAEAFDLEICSYES